MARLNWNYNRSDNVYLVCNVYPNTNLGENMTTRTQGRAILAANEINWAIAPEGCTHYSNAQGAIGIRYLKYSEGEWFWGYNHLVDGVRTAHWVKYFMDADTTRHTDPAVLIANPNVRVRTPRVSKMAYLESLRMGHDIDWSKVPVKVHHIELWDYYKPHAYDETGTKVLGFNNRFQDAASPFFPRKEKYEATGPVGKFQSRA